MTHYRAAAALQEEKLRQAASIPKRAREKTRKRQARRRPLLGLRTRKAV